ncbi:MAG TPA: hypothetical protein VGR45_03315 [Stellaceae bacterium]|nr:hypothetical protein [Stellaceae bacterium]
MRGGVADLNIRCGISAQTRKYRFQAFAVAALLAATLAAAPAAAEQQRYRSDDWVTECKVDRLTGAPDCAITVPFADTEGGEKGSFALVVALQSGEIGIVGRPFPLRATLQVDKNPPIKCNETRYCLFPRDESLAAIGQFNIGSVILIDVVTAKTTFEFSMTPSGFKAGMAQIEAWGYSFAGE